MTICLYDTLEGLLYITSIFDFSKRLLVEQLLGDISKKNQNEKENWKITENLTKECQTGQTSEKGKKPKENVWILPSFNWMIGLRFF